MRLRHVLASALPALAVLLALVHAPAVAQSDILLQLRSGSPAGDRFRVDSAGGVVALGQIGFGIIPASGAGWRMMWYPYKVAFRAGYADAGGQFDDANIGFYSWAGGGRSIAASDYSFSFGDSNTIEQDADWATALGRGNKVWGSGGSFANYGVAIGQNNDVMDAWGVALGNNNTSDGDAAIAIGFNSTADADYSMAFGYRASTNGHAGARVFADASTTDSIEATANNEFAVRAAGGFRFRSNATLTNGCNIAAGGASITCASSKTLKDAFTEVDGEDVLSRMRLVPVNTWEYIEETGRPRHMGPFAEDFNQAFHLGNDSLAIGHLDIDGVNFAGVKALEARTTALAAENARLASENEELKKSLAALLGRVERLEANSPNR